MVPTQELPFKSESCLRLKLSFDISIVFGGNLSVILSLLRTYITRFETLHVVSSEACDAAIKHVNLVNLNEHLLQNNLLSTITEIYGQDLSLCSVEVVGKHFKPRILFPQQDSREIVQVSLIKSKVLFRNLFGEIPEPFVDVSFC